VAAEVDRDRIDTLPEQVAERLGYAVDRMARGARLDPAELATAFGVSRRTVSRALTILQRAGKVTIMASRGAYVA
jgi:DNA-binding GntR family transcriptional regulator